MFKFPQAIKFHKKVAQLQIDLKPCSEKLDPASGKTRVEEGCLFFSIAKAKTDGSDKMDWDNKINMKIDNVDTAKIVTGVRAGRFPVDIFHKTSDVKSTALKIEAGNPGSYKLSMSKKEGADNQFASVYLSNEDMFLMFNLLEASVPLTLGWY